jgi:hypothetical protein
MEKFKLANGWTKETVMAQIKKYNNNTKAFDPVLRVCTYKTPYDNRCAIGCFIPDGHKALGCVGGADMIVECFPELKKLMPFAKSYELVMFQMAHDKCESKERGVYDAIQNFLDTEVE